MSPETEENRVILPNELYSLVLSQREKHRKERLAILGSRKGKRRQVIPEGKKPNPAGSISTDCGAIQTTALKEDALLICRPEALAVERVAYLCFGILSVANSYSCYSC